MDHIKEVQYYPELALDLDNLRTLCKDCHNRRHGRYQKKESRWDDETFEW
ncbi:homing endonuclease [Streptococcus phage Javan137]|nr:homing endonuclease [Streptococcus phage Javan137]